MVADWKETLADSETKDAEAGDFVRVLKTFELKREKMATWGAIFERNFQEQRGDSLDADGFSLAGPSYSFWSGVSGAATIFKGSSALVRGMLNLRSGMNRLENEIANATSTENLNCATFVLAAFPEANIQCRLGIPLLCKAASFESLQVGIDEMSSEVDRLLEQLSTQQLPQLG
jgi:hypothetical protein